jgi:acetyltransferase
VLTNAGGPGVTAADALESHGLHLAELSDETTAALKELLPKAASTSNPVDMLASASPEQYARSLKILMDDPGVQCLMVILPPPPMYTAGAVAKAIIPVIHGAAKPVVIALMGERLIQEAVEHFRAARIAEYRFPERAASAMAVLAQRWEYLSRAASSPVARFDVEASRAEAILGSYNRTGRTEEFLPLEIVASLLELYGIPTPPAKLARSPEQAVNIARGLDGAVALKLASPDIPHKSDVDGVILDVKNEGDIRAGFKQILENARRAHPEAEILGVHVQPMVAAGLEVIVGAVQDPQFGTLIMFGSGGVEVEGLKDIAFSLAPMTVEEAEHMLESTWAGRKLSGFRGSQGTKREAVLEVIQRLAQLAADLPSMAEIEINPLVVMPEAVYALDVRARLSDLSTVRALGQNQ